MLRADLRVVVDGPGDLGPPSQPRGVHEGERPAVELDPGVDRVAGRAGEGGDDHPLFAQELVDERRLADVGPADHREPRRLVLLGPRLRQTLDDEVEEVARPEPLGGRDRDRVAQPEPVELGRETGLGRGVDLVGRHHHRHRPAAQLAGELGVAGAQPRPGVDHQQRELGLRQRRPGLAADRLGQVARLGRVHAAGVHQRKDAAVPVGLDLLAIPGDPRLLVDHGLAAPAEAVDERRLAHVRIADYRDLGRRHLRPQAALRHPNEVDDPLDDLVHA